MTASEILAILTGVSGLVVGLIAALSGARKDQVSIMQTNLATMQNTIDGVVKENERLRARMKELEACIDESEKTILALTAQVDEWKLKYYKLQAEFDALKKSING